MILFLFIVSSPIRFRSASSCSTLTLMEAIWCKGTSGISAFWMIIFLPCTILRSRISCSPARKLSISEVSVVPPFFKISIFLSNSSRLERRKVIISVSGNISPSLILEKISSIEWAKFAISSNPIVADIPFKVCAERNSSFIISPESGFFSRAINLAFRFCRCSPASLI